MGQQIELTGPDLTADGIDAGEVAEGAMVVGHDGETSIVIVRTGGDVHALAAKCTHYGASLGKGAFDGDCLRCPWHHAAFAVTSGEAVRAPALDPVAVYDVEERDGRLFVTGARQKPSPATAHRTVSPGSAPSSVVIVGAGAAGAAAAEQLREVGYAGPITMIGAEESGPVDRPNLSKDYLAGNAPEEWIPLRGGSFYADREIDLRTGVAVEHVDVDERELRLGNGAVVGYGALLLATGAEPIRLDMPGGERLRYLRTLGDSRAIIAAAEDGASSALVVGGSFIGLEVAASLVERGLEVHVVAPEEVPMARVLGVDLGGFVRALHEEHGVTFHLGRTVSELDGSVATLDDGSTVPAGLAVAGIGVRPRVALAEAAGLTVDNGVVVDERLIAGDGIWAAGDIARFPHPRFGRIRVEHWVVAERQGQAAARSILDRGEVYADVPFFWSDHYDVTINYVGHAAPWDTYDIAGSIEDRDATVALRSEGRIQAIVTIFRDVASLEAERAFEQGDDDALEALLQV